MTGHDDFRRALAIDGLAVALYNSMTVYHNTPNEEGWRGLSVDERARYQQIAETQLIALAPDRQTDFSARLFRFGIDLARNAAKGER